VKLIYDENLSPAIVAQLADIYPGSAHVHDIGLGAADDLSVWKRAKDEGYCIVSKDSDYYDLSVLHGHPPKVIWLRLGNCSTETIFDCLRNCRAAIEEFGADEDESVLLIP
jgi:predicted nuclease of predicted toxin-antitoxin system